MLEQLRIRHLAVVEDLSIPFTSGLNLLTGETGAGKSMIVGSLALLLGGRADPTQVRAGRAAAIIEAHFAAADDDGPLIARREIQAEGRTRALLDGAPVSVQRLRQVVGERLLLLGQQARTGLLWPGHYLERMDRFAGLGKERRRAADLHRRLLRIEAELQSLQGDPERLRSRRELLEFQLDAIVRLDPQPGEDGRLRDERDRLRHTATHQDACEATAALLDSDDGAAAVLHRLESEIERMEGADPRFGPYRERIQEFGFLLQELGRDIDRFRDSIETRPERLAEVEERLSALQAVKNRHGGRLEEVVAARAEAEAELDRLRDTDGACRRLEEERGGLRKEYESAAIGLSEARRAAAVRMERRLTREIRDLAFARGATVQIEMVTVGDDDSPFVVDGVPVAWGPHGWDQVDLRLAANPGEPPRPLARIASGGEMSRLLLALQCLGAEDGPSGRTLVFDEIDAGVGAEVAAVVGDRLRRLGASHQVICVSHWAQVAAGADRHFMVEKEIADGRTRVAVRPLDGRDRQREVARMLGSRVAPATSLRHAGELLAALKPGPEER